MKLLLTVLFLSIVNTAHADPNVAKCASISHTHSSVAGIQAALVERAEALNAHNAVIVAVNYLLRETAAPGEAPTQYEQRRVEPDLIYTHSLGFTPSLSGPINFSASSEAQCIAELDRQLNLLAAAKSHVHHGSMSQFFLAAKDAGWFE